jgi:hypothetical protein
VYLKTANQAETIRSFGLLQTATSQPASRRLYFSYQRASDDLPTEPLLFLLIKPVFLRPDLHLLSEYFLEQVEAAHQPA